MKKFAAMILCGILLLTIGCSTPESIDNETKTENDEMTTTPETEEPAVDWEGREFIFVCTSENYDGGYYETIDIYVETEIGEVFNDAVYRRNKNVEEKYNIVIVENKYDNVGTTISNSVNAGDDICNAIFSMGWEALPHAQSGMLVDFNTIDNIDFAQPWWDSNIKENMSIGGKTYLMTGDISVMDDNCTILFFFNKKLIDDYKLSNPYDLLNSGNWTFDEYQKMATSVSSDLNGDGVYDDNDLFGTIVAYHYLQYMAHGSGMRYVVLDSEGYPEPTFMNDLTVNIIDKIAGLFFDNTVCAFYNKLTDPKGGNSYTYGRQLFANDQILFCLSQPLIFNEFRDMESEFGIMPTPKYDEQQDRYYSSVDIACSFLSVPKTMLDLEFTGYILEAFAKESMEVVTPAYYDIMLKRKYTRDDESAEVLDLISKSRLYDLGVFYGWGGINNIITNVVVNQNTDIQSTYAAIEKSVMAAIQKTVEAYSESAE